MNRKTWLITLLILATLVITIDFFFIHLLFPSKKKAFLESLFEKPTDNSAYAPLPAGLKVSYTPIERVGNDTYQKVLSDCFTDPDLRQAASPTDLIKALEKKFGLQSRIFNGETIFFKADQQERRIHIVPINGPQGSYRELSFFTIDASGLPSPVPLSEEQARNPTPEFLTSLIGNSVIFYHSLKETLLFADRTVAVVEWINDDTREIQITANEKTFSCQFRQCECRGN